MGGNDAPHRRRDSDRSQFCQVLRVLIETKKVAISEIALDCYWYNVVLNKIKKLADVRVYFGYIEGYQVNKGIDRVCVGP